MTASARRGGVSRRGGDGRRRRAKLALVALLTGLLVGGGAVAAYAKTQLDPPAGGHDVRHTIQVQSGETLAQLTDDLSQNGLIRSRTWFGIFARIRGLEAKLREGTYTLDSGMGASAIISNLESAAETMVKTVTFPEGLTAADMARRVAAAGVGVSAEQYLAEVKNGRFTEAFLSGRPAGASLEGFLFPSTYAIPAGTSAHDIVGMQIAKFGQQVAPLLDRADGLTVYQHLIIASLVEREAKFEPDRAQVSAVIHNRLQKDIPLGVDASLLYGLGIAGRGPTGPELQSDTPYNLRLHHGLPPTPIANPGIPSVEASVQPASVDYLYYVSDPCGHIFYSRTAAEADRQIAAHIKAPC